MNKLFKLLSSLIALLFFLITPVSAMAATLKFEPDSGTINKGCEISIKVILDTQGVQTDGTDLIVLYTPAQLSTSVAQIINGTTYPEYHGASVDQQTGKASVSGIAAVSNPFTGTGTLATIKFNVASTLTNGSQVKLNFDFDPNDKTKTTDTNVVERGTIADVLSSAPGATYTVGSGTCTSSSTSSGVSTPGTTTINTVANSGTLTNSQGQTLPGTTSGSSATQSAQYQVYRPNLNDLTGNGKGAGILDNTIIISVVGLALVVLGIAGLVLM